MYARRPDDLNLGSLGCPEPKVQPLVARREITASRGCESSLSIHSHPSPQPIPVATRSTQRHDQPMLLAAPIEKHLRATSEHGHHNILPSIIVQVTEGGSSTREGGRGARISSLKSPVLLGHEQGFPPVIV